VPARRALELVLGKLYELLIANPDSLSADRVQVSRLMKFAERAASLSQLCERGGDFK
jgi:hypothetical protein